MKLATNIGLQRFLAVDPALNNFGVAIGYYGKEGVVVNEIHLLATKPTKKQKILGDAERARLVARFLHQSGSGVDLIISEIPYGSKSSRAAWSLGMALGITSTVKLDCPILFVTPYQVKNVVKRGADKEDVITWAVSKHPNLNWRYYRGKLRKDNEHMADAIAVAYAGYGLLKSGRAVMLK